MGPPSRAHPLSGLRWATRRWPTAFGIAFAAFVAIGADHTEVAPVITASGFVYLGAAALGRPASAWPMFLVSFVVIGVGSAVPGFAPSWSSWCMVVIAAVLAVYGVVRGGLRPAWGLPLQAAAMVLLVASALAAVSSDARWAGALVGVGLLAHAAWDVYHHRVDRVVVRSMAEFCGVLDTLLALVVLGVTFTR